MIIKTGLTDINTTCEAVNNKLKAVNSCWATFDDEEACVSTPLDVQIGGSHYKDMPIQPAEYTQKNNLTYLEGAVVKYISRYKQKNGKEDLDKAIHCIELLRELEYGE